MLHPCHVSFEMAVVWQQKQKKTSSLHVYTVSEMLFPRRIGKPVYGTRAFCVYAVLARIASTNMRSFPPPSVSGLTPSHKQKSCSLRVSLGRFGILVGVLGGRVDVLGLTGLAVLFEVISNTSPSIASIGAINAYLPLGEAELGLATALSNQALVLLEAAANSAGRDGQVAVVPERKRGLAVDCHGRAAAAGRASPFDSMPSGQEKLTYERPAAFQADILTIGFVDFLGGRLMGEGGLR